MQPIRYGGGEPEYKSVCVLIYMTCVCVCCVNISSGTFAFSLGLIDSCKDCLGILKSKKKKKNEKDNILVCNLLSLKEMKWV